VNGSPSGALALRALVRVVVVLLVALAPASACSDAPETGATSASTSTAASEAVTSAEATVGAAAAPDHPHASWSGAELVRRLAGENVQVEGRSVPIDTETLTCAGQGAGRPTGGARVWTHFRCIQPTFPPGELVGPDASFLLHATGPTTFVVTDASFSRY
jgi:hypothetical protein